VAGRALTPVGVIIKWILIPVALVAIGFFVIGARIGKVLPGIGGGNPVTVTPVADAKGSPGYSSPDVQVDSSRTMAPPEVVVTSTAKPKHRRHRSHPLPGTDSGSQDSARVPEAKPLGPGT
jgi:hypothetical protein